MPSDECGSPPSGRLGQGCEMAFKSLHASITSPPAFLSHCLDARPSPPCPQPPAAASSRASAEPPGSPRPPYKAPAPASLCGILFVCLFFCGYCATRSHREAPRDEDEINGGEMPTREAVNSCAAPPTNACTAHRKISMKFEWLSVVAPPTQ